MLAAQMVCVHDTAMRFLAAGSRRSGMPADGATFFVNHAVRLMRLFTEQTDALARYRGKAPTEQKVTVKHVNVFHGGQAVVGNVTPNSRITTSPHAALADGGAGDETRTA